MIKFDLFWLKDRLNDRKVQLNAQKSQLKDCKVDLKSIYIEMDDQNDKIRSFLTIFDQIRPIFDINLTTFDINGRDSNQIVATSKSGC